MFGVTIGGAVLQNELHKTLPPDFQTKFPGGTAIAYDIIPVISSLAEPLKTEVRNAFATSLRVVWQVMVGVGALGFLISSAMKHLPLHTSLDENWGMDAVESGPKRVGPHNTTTESRLEGGAAGLE